MLALVNAGFLMTSTPSISLGTKHHSSITLIKENNFLLCSVVDNLVSQLVTEEGQDKHEHMRWFDS